MLREDAQRTHLATADEVVELYESTNQPLVQSPGHGAQPAQAAVAALAARGGYQIVVALTLLEAGRNVIYAGELVGEQDVPGAIEEALLFAESMGFILDSTGWPGLDAAQREELVERLGVFKPPQVRRATAAIERPKEADPLASVARLFAAFGLLLAATLAGCSGPSAEQRKRAAEIHYDLGTNMVTAGNPQGGLGEYLEALKQDDELPQLHNALGLVYGFSLGRSKEAELHFKRALELDENFSEASNNYGAYLLQLGRFTEAIPHFEKALANPVYMSRSVAETNLGWALYKTGQADKGIGRIKSALIVAPKFCLGWKQLGTIYSEQGKLTEAGAALERYSQACAEAPDAWMQLGKVQARLGKADEARLSLARCVELAKDKEQLSAECARLLKELGAR